MDIVNLVYVEELFHLWKQKSPDLPLEWKNYFDSLASSGEPENISLLTPSHVVQSNGHLSSFHASTVTQNNASSSEDIFSHKQGQLERLIVAYRDMGAFFAQINPLSQYHTKEMDYVLLTVKGITLSLDKESFGFTDDDLDKKFQPPAHMGNTKLPLRVIIKAMEETYCSHVGYEFTHIKNKVMRSWLQEQLESPHRKEQWSDKQKIRFQKDLIKAEELEKFIQSNFIGQKRFSLEGSETLVPAIHYLINHSIDHGIHDIVLGMSHRGRINLLVNAFRKHARETFATFIGKSFPHEVGGSGDVKYHTGHSFDYVDKESRKSVHLSMVSNPSHLEAVDPVVQGKARGIQRKNKDKNRKKVLPILIHGDSAFSGQGVVYELLNLSQLPGYRTGGTIHIIINNQIGFTTRSRDSRSTFFATDIAKAFHIPIFHANADYPEEVIRCINIALAWRQKFSADIIVDIYCYRKRGHNETDEPSFTHPMMYNMIAQHPRTRKLYGDKLAKENIYSQEDQLSFKEKYVTVLKKELTIAKESKTPSLKTTPFRSEWSSLKNPYSFEKIDTGIQATTLDHIASRLTHIPEDFHIHPKLKRIINDQQKSYNENIGLNWSFAEALSFGSLVLEGHHVRLSGEDTSRGTFSQRHATWWDTTSESPRSYTPLQSLHKEQQPFSVYDSPLSEFSILGFEYGFSLTQPQALVLWEAQFGDFANGAQVIIDQFISSGESKWHRASGLVLLLPHGSEGQGPEHSNAHIERFLQLCAHYNMQVVNCTTPAQYFHLLRRQIHQPFRKPLILMSPKSLLRSPLARSSKKDFVSGTSFQNVINDSVDPEEVSHILICSGKVFYDLDEYRKKHKITGRALIRLEQLYPFPQKEVHTMLSQYTKAKRILWIQEEPKNYGPWSFIYEHLSEIITQPLRYVGRKSSPSPAQGSHQKHIKELEFFLSEAFKE